MRRVPGSAAAAVFALLVIATVAAFAWSQEQKRDPLVLDRVTIGVAGKNNFILEGTFYDFNNDRDYNDFLLGINITTIPEPTTFLFLAGSVIGLAARKKLSAAG